MPRRNKASAFLMLALLAGPAAAQEAKPAPAPEKAKVAASTAAATTTSAIPEGPKTINEVYNAIGVRDPFVSILASGGASAVVSDSEEVAKPNIHNLQLRGILGKLAMIEDASSGLRFLVKADGKLYDTKGKAVPGVTGAIKSSTSVLLTTTADGDVQWLRLGEQLSKP